MEFTCSNCHSCMGYKCARICAEKPKTDCYLPCCYYHHRTNSYHCPNEYFAYEEEPRPKSKRNSCHKRSRPSTSNSTSTMCYDTGYSDCKRSYVPSGHRYCPMTRTPEHSAHSHHTNSDNSGRQYVIRKSNFNKLMAMVRDPRIRYCPLEYITSPRTFPPTHTTVGQTTEEIPPERPYENSRCLAEAEHESTTQSEGSDRYSDYYSIEDIDVEDIYRNNNIAPTQRSLHNKPFCNAKTSVKFLPPSSCLMLIKFANTNRMRKVDRQVQCSVDISSDFCSCSSEVCEFCAKKVLCTCDRIRCCMCGKLKSMADQKAHTLAVCRCPRTYKGCKMGSSFLRFNSSPALNIDIRKCDGNNRTAIRHSGGTR